MTDKTDNFDPDALVREFITAFEMPLDLNLAMNLFLEETVELMEAMALDLTDGTLEAHANVLKEGCDFLYTLSYIEAVSEQFGLTWTPDRVEQISNVLVEVIQVYGPERFEEAFRRVHASNMSKLGDDGKPIRREDGKVLKGPNYKPADLTDLATPSYLASNPKPNFLVEA